MHSVIFAFHHWIPWSGPADETPPKTWPENDAARGYILPTVVTWRKDITGRFSYRRLARLLTGFCELKQIDEEHEEYMDR